MNIWIVKYGNEGFDPSFIDNSNKLIKEIKQLKHHDILQKKIGKFHFFSIATKFNKSQKNYIVENEHELRGYSGLLIGKDSVDVDLRNIANINCETPEKYNGQFSLFELTNDSFSCKADNFGFHKVFYFKKGAAVYVTNYLELLEITGEIQPSPQQLVTDFLTNRFGVIPGYNTLFKNVFTLPEYGALSIDCDGFKVSTYKNINSLLTPKDSFEDNLAQTIVEFQNSANYLRNFHKSAIGLSGGFDGRLILSFFYNTKGRLLETFTYNRAGSLDLWIAAYLSRQFKVPHKIFKLNVSLKGYIPVLKEYGDSTGDPFKVAFNNCIGDFFETDDCFKVNLGGNGGDIDTVLGESQLKKLNYTDFRSLISSYCTMLVTHPFVTKEITTELALNLEKYFLEKYAVFEKKDNYLQLMTSSLFNLERFRGDQGFGYSQLLNTNKDMYAPFATESFNQTVFTATKKQLQRTLKEGIHYRIYSTLTEGKVPYAPILTAQNEFGKNPFQKLLNFVAPFLPKIIWKLNNGDTNEKMRRACAAQVNIISKEYIKAQGDSELWQILNYNKIKDDLYKNEYKGQYNQIATMLKFLENRK